jgi:hypothetical protein
MLASLERSTILKMVPVEQKGLNLGISGGSAVEKIRFDVSGFAS